VIFGNECPKSFSGGPGNGITYILQMLQVSQVVCKMTQSDMQRICNKFAAFGVATVEKVCCKRMRFCGQPVLAFLCTIVLH
jgi:hypothetical protein